MKWFLLAVLIFSACKVKTESETNSLVSGLDNNSANELHNPEDSTRLLIDQFVKNKLGEINLIDVHEFDPRIQVDLKYATKDNFMKKQLYDTLRHAYLQEDVVKRLSKCQDFLDSIKPGYRLLVYDGMRPVQVQWEMWNALDSIPAYQRGKFVSNPAMGSVHNFGAAVDLTIVNSQGKPLDMGAGYDDFREVAFPKNETRFLASGELSKKQVENRKLLRRVMSSQRFSNIPSEWWHFNATSRINASYKYQLLVTESGDAKWFKIVPKISNQSDSLTKPR